MPATPMPRTKEEFEVWEKAVIREKELIKIDCPNNQKELDDWDNQVQKELHEMGDTVPEGGKDTNPKDIVGSSKPGVTSVPMQVMAELGNAMLEGQKYGRHNYRVAGVRASVYVDAVWRHLFLQFWDQGEDVDRDSGLSHVTKAIASLVVLRDSMLQGNFVDDRPPKAVIPMEEFQRQADVILHDLKPLPPWTEKRMQEEESKRLMEKEHVDVDNVKSNGSASLLSHKTPVGPKARL